MKKKIFVILKASLAGTIFLVAGVAVFSFSCSRLADIFKPDGTAPEASPPVDRRHPAIGDYYVYYGSFHNHSIMSDGMGTAEEAYRYARDSAGLDYFGLSDHDLYFYGNDNWVTLKAIADSADEDGEFTALWGFEWSSYDYHLTVVNTDTFCISETEETYNLKSLCAWLDAHNGIATLNHAIAVDFNGPDFEDITCPGYDGIIGMELFNKNRGFSFLYYNEGYDTADNHKTGFDEALTRGLRFGAAGGFDDHWATWGTANDYRLAVLAKNLTRKDVYAALEERRFFATLDKNIALSFAIGGHEMGAIVPGGNASLEIRVNDADSENFTKIVMIDRDHETRRLWEPRSCTVAISDTLHIASGDYYYLIVTQEDGDEAISSPIWVADAIPDRH